MSGIEAYLIPHAIADATAGVSVIFYLNDLTTTSANHAVITPNVQLTGSQATTSIITLSNGARYDVNQTYTAPTILAPFTWQFDVVATKAAKLANLTEEQMGNYLGGIYGVGLEGVSNARVYAICLRPAGAGGPNTYAHVLARISNYTFTVIAGMQHRKATGSVTFDPIDTEWQAGWPSP